jgi:hypothetical protein
VVRWYRAGNVTTKATKNTKNMKELRSKRETFVTFVVLVTFVVKGPVRHVVERRSRPPATTIQDPLTS